MPSQVLVIIIFHKHKCLIFQCKTQIIVYEKAYFDSSFSEDYNIIRKIMAKIQVNLKQRMYTKFGHMLPNQSDWVKQHACFTIQFHLLYISLVDIFKEVSVVFSHKPLYSAVTKNQDQSNHRHV